MAHVVPNNNGTGGIMLTKRTYVLEMSHLEQCIDSFNHWIKQWDTQRLLHVEAMQAYNNPDITFFDSVHTPGQGWRYKSFTFQDLSNELARMGFVIGHISQRHQSYKEKARVHDACFYTIHLANWAEMHSLCQLELESLQPIAVYPDHSFDILVPPLQR